MQIEILQLVEGAKKATGLTVVIDVFRAFSTACYVFDRGARSIISVGEVSQAFRLQSENAAYILMGERNERMVEGFDFGNSPYQLEHVDFSGKTVIQTTSAGTRGLVSATGADTLLTGSFVNAGAIIEYIRKQDPDHLSLVCMGYGAEYPVEEDTLCAEYLRDSLEGKKTGLHEMTERIRLSSGQRFFLPENQQHTPSTDFYMCLDTNRFSFVLQAEILSEGMMKLEKINI